MNSAERYYRDNIANITDPPLGYKWLDWGKMNKKHRDMMYFDGDAGWVVGGFQEKPNSVNYSDNWNPRVYRPLPEKKSKAVVKLEEEVAALKERISELERQWDYRELE